MFADVCMKVYACIPMYMCMCIYIYAYLHIYIYMAKRLLISFSLNLSEVHKTVAQVENAGPQHWELLRTLQSCCAFLATTMYAFIDS